MSDDIKSDEHTLIPVNSINIETKTHKDEPSKNRNPSPLSLWLNDPISILVRLALITMAMMTFIHTGDILTSGTLLYFALHPDHLQDNRHLS